MSAVRKYMGVVDSSNSIRVDTNDLQPGVEVEVLIRERQTFMDPEEWVRRMRALQASIAETQDVSKWTMEAIQAEIDAYRRGE